MSGSYLEEDMQSTFEAHKRKHVLCPTSASSTCFQGVVCKEPGPTRYELVREFGICRETALMLQGYREGQSKDAMEHHEKHFHAFSRKLVNTVLTYPEWKKNALDPSGMIFEASLA